MNVRRLLLLLAALVGVGLQPGQALAASAASQPHTTVLFAGGYGSTLAVATRTFGPLRAALQARDPNLDFAVYSYTGWDADSCSPHDYSALDTGQSFDTSERRLLETINALHTRCGAAHVVVVGHSLGGLVAFHALSDNPMGEVSDVVTVDSPLGGAPATEVGACIDAGLCVDGPVSSTLSDLYAAWHQTAADNAARVRKLASVGIRTTAWGNQSDCLYSPGVCVPFARAIIGDYDAPETQWLGVDRAMRRDYSVRSSLANLLNSHQMVIANAASDIAADLFA